MAPKNTRAKGCDSREAIVAFRWDGEPPFLPGLPNFDNVNGNQPSLKVPVATYPTLATFGEEKGGPREWWIQFSAATKNTQTRLEVDKDTPGVPYPNSQITRARIILDGRDIPLVFETDLRGIIITPPTASGTIELLSYPTAVRLDKGSGVLPVKPPNGLYSAIDTINVFYRSVQQHDAVGRLTRTNIKVSTVDDWAQSTVVNPNASFFKLAPFVRRVRYFRTQLTGGGMVDLQLLVFAASASSVDQLATIELTEGEWTDASNAVGLRPVLQGNGAFNIHVEQECFI